MPFAHSSGARLWWRADGHPGAPALVLGNSLGTDHALWDPVVARLADRFRVIRMDTRGHGASDAPVGDYTIDQLGRDVLAVADAAGATRFAYAGVSLGGMVGMWLGAHAADRVTHLVLCNTGARLAPTGWADRIARVQKDGMAGIVDMVMARFFTEGFVARRTPFFDTVRETFLRLDPVGYVGCCAAIRDMDQRPALARITAPTLVVVGDHDQATPRELGEAVAAGIAGARLIALPVAHIPHVEIPGRFVDEVVRFLGAIGPMHETGRFDAGLARRKEVLGAKYVEGRLAAADPFTAEFQDLITRYAWGEIWTRPVFDDRTRRLLTLGMMIAAGRWGEFELHVRQGLDAELTTTDLKELLLQSAIYCGVPAANTGFHHAVDILKARAAPR